MHYIGKHRHELTEHIFKHREELLHYWRQFDKQLYSRIFKLVEYLCEFLCRCIAYLVESVAHNVRLGAHSCERVCKGLGILPSVRQCCLARLY